MDALTPAATIRRATEMFGRLILFTCLLLAAASSLAAQQPIIISTAGSQYQQLLVQSVAAQLKDSGIEARILNIDEQDIAENSNELMISIGGEAAAYLDKIKSSAPQLRIVTQLDENKVAERNDRQYLSMTQSLCQQFELIRALNSDWKNVSMLLSDNDSLKTQALKTCAERHKLSLKIIIISQYVHIIDALNTSLENSDVLLAMPDASVYNAKTIKSILLTTYRHKVPVIGFSESFVQAGALAALHSSPEQLGKQAAELIKKHYNGEPIKNQRLYPKYFDIAINNDVAKSLAITIPDRKSITKKLENKNNE